MAWPIEVRSGAILRVAAIGIVAHMGRNVTHAATGPVGAPTSASKNVSVGGKGMKNTVIKYCTRAKNVNFNPFRADVNPYEINYLQTFTKPIMGEHAIVEKFYFAPDGLEMRGMVARDAVLARSGRVVSPVAVGNAIQKLIDLRIPTRGFRVSKVEATDEKTFKLTFENKDKVENIPGVLRELLERQSGGAKTTFWVADPDAPDDFVTRHPVEFKDDTPIFDVGGYSVTIVGGEGCKGADIYDYPASEADKSITGYDTVLSSEEGIGLAMFNTSSLNHEERRRLLPLLRIASKSTVNSLVGTRFAETIILPGELGHSGTCVFDESLPGRRKEIKPVHIRLSARTPLFLLLKEELTRLLPENGFHPIFSFHEDGGSANKDDVYVALFPLTMGRQKWMQGSYHNLGLLPLLDGAPKTRLALERARETAAATIPTNAALVSNVEKAACEETSISPILRRKGAAMNKSSSPVVFRFDEHGRSYLARKEK